MQKREKKSHKVIIISVLIIIIAAIILGTFYLSGFFNHRRAGFTGQNFKNFQINESQINDITSFFNSNPSLSKAQNYCSANRSYCFYYCRSISPNNEICSQIMNFSRMNNSPRGSQQ